MQLTSELKLIRDKSRVKAGLFHQPNTCVFAQQCGELKPIREKSRVKNELVHQLSSHNKLARANVFATKARLNLYTNLDNEIICMYLSKYGERRTECKKLRRRHFFVALSQQEEDILQASFSFQYLSRSKFHMKPAPEPRRAEADARFSTILISVARVILSLIEEIELSSNCNDTLIQQRSDQCRSAEAGTQACWRHDASPLHHSNPATIDCGKPAKKPAKTHHWPSRAGCPTADLLFELHVVEKLRVIAVLRQFPCSGRSAQLQFSRATQRSALSREKSGVTNCRCRNCLPPPQQLARWAPKRLTVERTEVPEHRHKQARERCTEATVGLRRCMGEPDQNLPVLGSAPVKIGCSDLLQTSRRNTHERPEKHRDSSQERQGTRTGQPARPTGTATKRRPGRVDPTSLPQELESDARGQQKTTQPFQCVTSLAHTEPVGPCRLDLLFNAFCPVGGLQTRWPCPPAHESRARAHHRWAIGRKSGRPLL